MTISVDEGDQTRRKRPKINGGEFFTAAHNGLVADRVLPGPPEINGLVVLLRCNSESPRQKRLARF
jgi:hypothetical protein